MGYITFRPMASSEKMPRNPTKERNYPLLPKKSQPCLPPGARRVPNPGGGSCLYHALAQAESKPGKLRSHRQLRAFLHAYLTKHCAKFSPFWDQRGPDDQLVAGSWEDYLEAMSKDKSWGGGHRSLFGSHRSSLLGPSP